MIRFIDLRGQETGYNFAFWDTDKKEFVRFESEQAWVEWADFSETVWPVLERKRYEKLCPDWVLVKGSAT